MIGIAIVIPVVLGSLAVGAALIGSLEVRRQKRARFAGREPQDDQSFFKNYYEKTGLDPATVAAVRSAVAKALELPGEFLRPGDRFDSELAPIPGWHPWWDDGLDVMWSQGILVMGKRYPVDSQRIVTLDDLIRQVGIHR